MTTIQDRIIKKMKIRFPNGLICNANGSFDNEWNNVEQFLIKSIKEVEEETKGDVLNKLHAMVCDLATDKGKDLSKEDCLELIIYKIERIYGKKLLFITNKEKQ